MAQTKFVMNLQLFAQTKLANLVNPEVLADMISAQLPSANKLLALFPMDSTLEGRAGDTITVPKYEYIGDAVDLAEGIEGTTVQLTSTTSKATVKKCFKAVEITDEAMLSAYGDPMGETRKQLTGAIAGKVANDIVTALDTTTNITATVTKLDYMAVSEALDRLVVTEDKDQEFERYLLVNRLDVRDLREDPHWIQYPANTDVVKSGAVGEVAGAKVMIIDKIPSGSAYLVMRDGVKPYRKRDVAIEVARNIMAKTTIISADQHYVATLYNEGSVVKIPVGSAPAVFGGSSKNK